VKELTLCFSIVVFMKDGVAPEVSVKLPAGNVLSLHTWSDIIQLNVLRHFLGEGFQRHMQVGTSQIHFF
jgi:hypothetical protein